MEATEHSEQAQPLGLLAVDRGVRPLAERLRLVHLVLDWPAAEALMREAAEEIEAGGATIEALHGTVLNETARADRLYELALEYAMACGELSKALTPGDPMWLELRDLGERLDGLAQRSR